MSSRKMIILLDGLPGDSWYKQSVHEFINELAAEEEETYGNEVRSHIFAQLHGQSFERAEEST